MKKLVLIILGLALLGLFYFWGCNSTQKITLKDKTIYISSSNISCGNNASHLALLDETAIFNDRHIISWGFESYHPDISKDYQEKIFGETIQNILDCTGRKSRMTNPIYADIVVSFSETDGNYAFIENLVFDRVLITYNKNVNFFYPYDFRDYVDFERTSAHEIGHGLGLVHHIGCNCIMENTYSSMPNFVDYDEFAQMLFDAGYCYSNRQLSCQSK